jgi:hypothetical protein
MLYYPDFPGNPDSRSVRISARVLSIFLTPYAQIGLKISDKFFTIPNPFFLMIILNILWTQENDF